MPGQDRDPFGQRQQDRIFDQPRPIFLSGKVVMDNGEIPPEPVVIERVCNGQPTPEAYTDSKGRFSFQVGGNQGMMIMDASTSGANDGLGMGMGQRGIGGMNQPGGFGPRTGPMGDLDMTGCELRAALPGFRSDGIQLNRRRSMDNPDVGVIVLHSLGARTESVISITTLEAPQKARSSYEKALREMGKRNADPEKAIKELEKAVELYPRFAAAWTVMGDARLQLNDEEGAIEALENAIEADPQYVRPYGPLVKINVRQQNWERVAELSDAMLRLIPGQTEIRYFNAVANFSMGNLEAAETVALGIQNGADAKMFPQTHQMMGIISSQRGNFGEAATHYRQFLEVAPDSPSAARIQRQLHEWEVLGVIDSPNKSAVAR